MVHNDRTIHVVVFCLVSFNKTQKAPSKFTENLQPFQDIFRC